MNLNDFESLSSEQKEVLGKNPHVFVATTCMKMIGFWTARSVMYNPIAYVFEQGSDYDKHIRKLFKEELHDEDRDFYRVGSLTLADKRVKMPLQAADIFAYEAMKEVARKLTPMNRRHARESGKNLSRRETDEWLYSDRTALVETYESTLLRRRAYGHNAPPKAESTD